MVFEWFFINIILISMNALFLWLKKLTFLVLHLNIVFHKLKYFEPIIISLAILKLDHFIKLFIFLILSKLTIVEAFLIVLNKGVINLKTSFLWIVYLMILMIAFIIRVWRRKYFIIFTLFAFAFISTWNVSFIAFTISFLAPRVFTVAALWMHILLVNFIIKSIYISFKNLFNRISSFLLVLQVVEASSIMSALAILSAKSIVS